MLGGGEDARYLIPLMPDGNIQGSDGRGCHRGDFDYLNPRNTVPGRTYYHAVRSHAGVQKAAIKGWQVVQPDDPERLGDSNNPDFQAAGLDGFQTAGETVLMYMPEDRYAIFCKQREEAAERMREDPAREYTQSNEAISLQERYGGKAIHVRGSGHGMQRL